MAIEITFRTLKGTVFKLSASESDTVLNVKRLVGEHQNVDDFAAYRLIYKGNILKDDATVSSSNITSGGFVVVMPPKKIPTKTKQPTPSASKTTPKETTSPALSTPKESAQTSAPSASDEKKDSDESSAKSDVKMDGTISSDTPSSSTSAAAASSTPESSPEAASALVTGSAYEDSVKRICEMGFPEEQVKLAMRAAFNNPDRAVEFLFSGIPDVPEMTASPRGTDAVAPIAGESTGTDASQQPSIGSSLSDSVHASAAQRLGQAAAQGTPFDMFAPPNAGMAGARDITGADIAAGGGSGNLDFLRDLPLFGHIRSIVQANPAALPQILQHLSSVHPDLISLIEGNQEEFSRLINEPLRDGEGITDESMEQMTQTFAAGGGVPPPQGAGGTGNATQVYVTPEERDQINRLNEFGRSIGLAQGQVLETWLACNRDEDLTANFLFDHADELRADRAEDQPQNNDSDSGDRGQEDPDASTDRPPS